MYDTQIKLIKIAYENPYLRESLLPVILKLGKNIPSKPLAESPLFSFLISLSHLASDSPTDIKPLKNFQFIINSEDKEYVQKLVWDKFLELLKEQSIKIDNSNIPFEEICSSLFEGPEILKSKLNVDYFKNKLEENLKKFKIKEDVNILTTTLNNSFKELLISFINLLESDSFRVTVDKEYERIRKKNQRVQETPEEYAERRKRINEYRNLRRLNDPEWRKKDQEKAKKFRERNPNYMKEWIEKNPEKWQAARAKVQADVRKRLNDIISTGIGHSLRKKNMTKGDNNWREILGYTMEDLRKHLESQFQEGMTWGNQGSYWHIDHIKPVSFFRFSDMKDPEFKECWSLSNLRPLPAKENIKKLDHYEGTTGRSYRNEQIKKLEEGLARIVAQDPDNFHSKEKQSKIEELILQLVQWGKRLSQLCLKYCVSLIKYIDNLELKKRFHKFLKAHDSDSPEAKHLEDLIALHERKLSSNPHLPIPA